MRLGYQSDRPGGLSEHAYDLQTLTVHGSRRCARPPGSSSFLDLYHILSSMHPAHTSIQNRLCAKLLKDGIERLWDNQVSLLVVVLSVTF